MQTTTDQPSPRPRRGRLLLIGALMAAAGLAWFAVALHRAARQREAVARLKDLGAWVFYNCRYDDAGRLLTARTPGPKWLQKTLGVDFFGTVDGVKLTEVGNLEGLGDFESISRPCPDVTDQRLLPLKTLPRLQWLALSGTQVTDAGLEHVATLDELERLWLDDTAVTDAGLQRLATLKRLTTLSLRRSRVTDDGLRHLEGLTGLRRLRLDGTGCSLAGVLNLLVQRQGRSLADALETIGCAQRDDAGNVVSLDLTGLHVADEDLACLEGLNSLQWLFLRGTAITDDGLKHLEGLTELNLLHLADTRVTDAGLEHLTHLPKLRNLHLRGTRVTKAGGAKLQAALSGPLRVYWDQADRAANEPSAP